MQNTNFKTGTPKNPRMSLTNITKRKQVVVYDVLKMQFTQANDKSKHREKYIIKTQFWV